MSEALERTEIWTNYTHVLCEVLCVIPPSLVPLPSVSTVPAAPCRTVDRSICYCFSSSKYFCLSVHYALLLSSGIDESSPLLCFIPSKTLPLPKGKTLPEPQLPRLLSSNHSSAAGVLEPSAASRTALGSVLLRRLCILGGTAVTAMGIPVALPRK